MYTYFLIEALSLSGNKILSFLSNFELLLSASRRRAFKLTIKLAFFTLNVEFVFPAYKLGCQIRKFEVLGRYIRSIIL